MELILRSPSIFGMLPKKVVSETSTGIAKDTEENRTFLNGCEAVLDVKSVGSDVLRFKFDASKTPQVAPEGVFFTLDGSAF